MISCYKQTCCFLLLSLLMSGCATIQFKKPVDQIEKQIFNAKLNEVDHSVYGLLERQQGIYVFSKYSYGLPQNQLSKHLWVKLSNGQPMWSDRVEPWYTYEKKKSLGLRVPDCFLGWSGWGGLGEAMKNEKCTKLLENRFLSRSVNFSSLIFVPLVSVMTLSSIGLPIPYNENFDLREYSNAFQSATRNGLSTERITQAAIHHINESLFRMETIKKQYNSDAIIRAYYREGLIPNPELKTKFTDLLVPPVNSLPELATSLVQHEHSYRRVAANLDDMVEQTNNRRLANYKARYARIKTSKEMKAFLAQYRQEGYDPLGYIPQGEAKYKELLAQEAQQLRNLRAQELENLRKAKLRNIGNTMNNTVRQVVE